MKKYKNFKHLKKQALEQAEYKCQSCGKKLDYATSLVDHIKPKSEGGTSQVSNIQILCEECNQAKVLKALENKRWEYRTVAGVAKETKINEAIVRSVLETSKDKVRESFSLSRTGNKLYTLKSRKSAISDIWTSMKKLSNDKFEAAE